MDRKASLAAQAVESAASVDFGVLLADFHDKNAARSDPGREASETLQVSLLFWRFCNRVALVQVVVLCVVASVNQQPSPECIYFGFTKVNDLLYLVAQIPIKN